MSTLTGPDVSRWQGVVDWSRVADVGHSFAWAKASQGVTWVDPQLARNRSGIPAAGLVPGFYHFLDHEYPGDRQARHFVSTVGSFAGRMACVDVESEGAGNPTIDQVETFAREFARLTGGHPLVVYTSWGWWSGRDRGGRGIRISPWLWHARYRTVSSGPGPMYGGWPSPTFWQHTSSGSCPGISGNCDLNVFYGRRARLDMLAGRGGSTPIPGGTDDMTPEERDWLDGELAVIRRKVENTYNQVNRKAGTIYNAVIASQVVDADDLADKVTERLVAAGAGDALDVATVRAGVREGIEELARLLIADDDEVPGE